MFLVARYVGEVDIRQLALMETLFRKHSQNLVPNVLPRLMENRTMHLLIIVLL